jgi:prophage DNA circulation protein
MAEWRNEYADSLQKVTVNTVNGYVECIAASYDGVPFFFEETETSGGREIVTTALPFSDKHVNQDIGKKVKGFSLSIYLVGKDCELDRERLEEAFNREGAFEFVHPYYGRFNARCTEYKFKYTSNVYEYAEGEATFVPEEDPKKSARSVVDLRGTVIAKAEQNLDSAKGNFAENFSIIDKAKSVVDSVSSQVSSLMDSIESARQSMRDVSEFVQTVSKIRENIQLVLNTPTDFAARIQDLLTLTKETVSPDGGFNNYVNESLAVMSSRSETSESSGSTASGLIAEIDRLVVMSAASMAVQSVVNSSFVSADEAREMHDNVATVFEATASSMESVDDYANLADLEATALKYLRDEMSKLAEVVELPLSASRNVLSICFDCYGNLDKLDDIIERNDIGDPLLVTRESLKVLSK